MKALIDQITTLASNFEFFVCDWNPNGTNDLLIVPEGSSEIYGSVSELCFGIDAVEDSPDDQTIAHAYHSHVTPLRAYDENEIAEQKDLITYVKYLSIDAVLASIAVSPTKDETEQLEALLKELTKLSK